ncbi:MAG: Stk1 family PASTA domain-containing Ser/Thr kinase [Erysipelotrichia bacterium]|nr:Stk1 family PASTA domain-containing Ser/Thr kinase [Erysipelotrichia bacterium]
MSTNMIANRYEVFQHIGQGGMADVFLAVDTILNRQVAIKILRSELSTDAISVARFEREAQAATALSHPNIVEIYDVGDYKGHHYIVMEFVPGKTLKQVIQGRHGLLKEEAVDVMKQLVSAIAEAHKREIIHRDIKPQNVIIKADGTIKVLDFGIAIAKGSNQLTQANNVMGSVHYLAPELAKGEHATVQSDIYALGIVLYEMLTGDVPFKAENAVQVALMHMRNEMPDARSINPEIPQSLDNIIIRSTAKDPRMRYASCNEMLEELRVCMRPERLNEPRLILRSPAAAEASKNTKASKYDRPTAQQRRTQPRKPDKSGQRVVRPAVEHKQKGNKLLMIVLVICLSLLAVAGIYFAATTSGLFQPKVTTATIPNIIGMSLTDAKSLCNENEIYLDTNNVTYTLTSDTEKGKIISVSPNVGTEVEKNSSITVSVSSGIGVRMKDYTGYKLLDAENDLAQYKNMKVTTQEENSDTAAPGTVIRQELMAAGTEFNPESTNEIRLIYASYPTVTIPTDLEGKKIEEAVSELEEMGLTVLTSNLDTTGLSETEIANLKTGIVIKCDPEMGTEYTQTDTNHVILYCY